MKRLNRNVAVGEFIYPTGQVATAELEEAIVNPEFWDDDTPAEVVAASQSGDAVDYDSWLAADLHNEVARRNEGLAPDDERYVTVSGKGNKPDLVAALTAHDEQA